MVDMFELGWIFFFSLIGLLLAMRVKMPPVIGVLLAGMLIGPHALGLVKGSEVINAFAEIGAILLLFVIGIEFSLSKIVQFGMRAILLAFVKITFVFVLVYELSLLFGLSTFDGLLIGAFFSFSSTTLFSKLVRGHELTNKNEINLLFAVLIIEDLLAVFVIAVLSAVPAAQSILLEDFAFSVVKSLAALIICYFILQKIVNLFFEYFATFKTTETMIFASLSICALFVFLATFFGFDASIGAFLAGSVIASVREFRAIEKTMLPFGLFFSSFFFLSMGMMVDPAALYAGLPLIFALFIVNIAAKFTSVGFGVYFLGSSIRASIFSAISMLTIGEFSLLIAKKAQPLVSFDIIGLTSASVFLSALAAAVLMQQLAPLTIQAVSVIPMEVRNNSKTISRRFSNVITEFEPKGSFFRLFTNETKKVLLCAVALLLVNGLLLLLEHFVELAGLVSFAGMPYSAIRIGAHLLVSAGLLLKMFDSISRILDGVVMTFRKLDRANLDAERRITNDGVGALALFGVSALLPFAFSVMQLPAFFNYLAILPLVPCVIFLWDMFTTTERTLKTKIKDRYKYDKPEKRFCFGSVPTVLKVPGA